MSLTVQLERLAIAMVSPNPEREEQAARTLRAQQEAIRAADESIAALREMVAQLQARRASDLASFQGRIAVQEQTIATQRAEITALEALQVKSTRIAALAPLETQDTCKLQRFLGEFYTASKALASYPVHYTDCFFRDPRPPVNQVPAQLKALQELINERLARPIDSVLDREIQQADTLKLEELNRIIMCAIDATWSPSLTGPSYQFYVNCREQMLAPLRTILTPLIAARRSRIRFPEIQ